MLKTRKLLLYIAILMALVGATPAVHAASLSITVKSDKQYYLLDQAITIQGYLSYNGLSVPYNAVGLQVWNPDNTLVVSRTLQTDASGNYGLTFSLPAEARYGTYDVRVSATYNGENASASTAFIRYQQRGVGGFYFQVNKFELLAPYIGLASILLIATVAMAISIKRVKRGKQKQ